MLDPSVPSNFINDIGLEAEMSITMELIETSAKDLEGVIKNCVERLEALIDDVLSLSQFVNDCGATFNRKEL